MNKIKNSKGQSENNKRKKTKNKIKKNKSYVSSQSPYTCTIQFKSRNKISLVTSCLSKQPLKPQK